MAYDDFLDRVREYLAASDISKTAFGLRSVGDPCFVTEVVEGDREARRATRAKVIAWMEANPIPERTA